MKRRVVAVALLAAGCSASVHVDHRAAHPATDPSRPPPGWHTLFSRDGTRALYDNIGKGGSFTVAADQQVELAMWADGDVQRLGACLVDISAGANDCDTAGPILNVRTSRPQRAFSNSLQPGRYTLTVAIEGAATWHVRVFGQG